MINAIVLQIKITIPSGIIVDSPIIPTNGDTSATPPNDKIPKNAEALPAASPSRCIPKEKVVVFTTPALETTNNNADNIAQIGNQNSTTTIKSRPPIKDLMTPAFNKSISSIVEDSLPVSCASIIIPKPFTAKITENCCELTPYIFCNTKGDPAI